MTTNTHPDLVGPNPAHTTQPTHAANHQAGGLPFTPLEAAFLRLFGHHGLFGGIAPALAEVVDALSAAHQVYSLQRFAGWADGGRRFASRIEELESAGMPELGLPSTEEENPAPGDMLSRLEDHSLEEEDLQRVRALFGARIASALSKNEPLPRSAIEAHESLLICRRNRSRHHEDWRTVGGHTEIDEAGLRALKVNLKSAVARDFIDDCLLALASAIADPNAASVNTVLAAGKAECTEEPAGDDEDPTELGYGQPADVSLAGPWDMEPKPGAPEGQGQPVPDGSPAEAKKLSLIGWRIVDGLHAPFTRKLGVTTTWGASPLADHTIVCRALKHDFLVGDIEVKNTVSVAYHSQQCSLPPQHVLTVPLRDTGGLFYDVKDGCYWAPYSQVLGKEDEGGSSKETKPRYGRLRIAIDPDIAQHHRDQHACLPGATSIGDLVEAGTTPDLALVRRSP